MIRKAAENDMEVLVKIEKECFPVSPWTKEQFLYELNENPFATVWVNEVAESVTGYIDVWILYEQAQIANIAVASAYRNRGYAQKLLEHSYAIMQEKGCEYLSLEVRNDNLAAIALYKKNGFIQASVRRHYYEDGTDALLMVKPVGGSYDGDIGN